ncbi:MAG: hypothetical protein RL095_1357 [Verrucomicrobiota bacterium]|jgi:hypothetical protein
MTPFQRSTRRLLELSRRGELRQSYLLSGDRLGELSSFARTWVRLLACDFAAGRDEACGTCSSCRMWSGDKHPRLHALAPTSKSREIPVAEMRNFMQRFDFRAEEGRHQIGLVIEAECLNQESQNAFLKTLEEPPAGAIFILVSCRNERLLPTIRSRCQIVNLMSNDPILDPALLASLQPLLSLLRPGSGAAAGLKAADGLLALFKAMKERASMEIEEALANELEAGQDDDAPKKKDKERAEALAGARYRALRDQVLSILETWVAEASAGQDAARPHQIFTGESLSPLQSARLADLIESLKIDLNFNLNETLAVECFCTQAAKK